MKSSTQTRLGSSPEGSRKLEVQNASDDDGFEEVTHAADLGDDAKDDFDEKPEAGDLLASTKSETPLSFLDKDDDEFVDEPLSSPRLNTEKELPESEPASAEWPEQTLTPLSPTGELAQEVQAIGLEEDTHMVDTHIEDSDRSTAESSKHSPGSSEESTESPPAAEEEKPLESTPAASEAVPPPEPMDEILHPEDKPAPLFAKKVESPQETTNQVSESHSSTESSDTTMGEAGDSSNSILMGNTEEHIQQPLTNASTVPVVGDFLKMQFVEHKVVPTILVSHKLEPRERLLKLIISGFLLSISLEQLSS
jgi:SIT4-associating protein SAP185/190